MKKVFWLACFLLFSPFLSALPLGNPLSPALLYDAFNPYWIYNCCPNARCSVGFYGDYVFNRHLRVRRAFPERHVDKTRIITNAGILNIDFFQAASLFTTVGTTSINMQSAHAAFFPPFPNEIVFLEYDPAISWSVGGRGILWQCGCFSFGLESQYFVTRPSVRSLRPEGRMPIYLKHKRATYWEYQIGFGAAGNYCIGGIGRLSPYIGFKWSIVDFHTTGANRELIIIGDRSYFLRNFENARDLGLCLGLSLALYDTWIATVEGNFADENALSVNIRVRF
jgi:hypothetical protein